MENDITDNNTSASGIKSRPFYMNVIKQRAVMQRATFEHGDSDK